MKAVIMAGGKGTRLRPLTSNMPKPMVPLLGRPCMEYIIELLKRYGITEIAVTLQYLPESIKSYFGDGSDFGVHIVYFEESRPLGTAGSVKNCEEFLNDRFLVISGDALTDFDLQRALDFHAAKQATATLVLTQVDNPLEYGVVMTNEEGNVTRFLEKPTWSEVFSDTVNTGIYIIEPEVLELFEKDIEFDFSKDLFPMLLSQGKKLMGYVAEGYWSDIGNLEIYRTAQFDLLDGIVEAKIKAKEYAPGIYAEGDVYIAHSTQVTAPAFIGRGTLIEGGATIEGYTITGRNNIIKEGALLSKAILWDHNFVSSKAEVVGATICHRTLLGEGSQIAEGVVMGDDCRIGSKAHIKAGVKIWPNKDVESNSTVHSSLIWGVKLSKALFSSYGIKGISNIDITPDFAARLAAAMASVFKPGATVSLSSCTHSFSRLLKMSMMAGLNAAGLHTVDFGPTISAAARYGVKAYSTDWGVHIRTGTEQNGETVIEVLDHQGLPICKNTERKIENSYWQEDFSRATVDKVGMHRLHPVLADDYIGALKRGIPVEQVMSSKFQLVLDYDSTVLGQSAMSLLSSMGCRVIQMNSDDRSHLGELIETVKKNKADLGVRMDRDARKYTFVTDEGKAISDDMMIALHLLIHSDQEIKGTVRLGIPVSAPREIERLATQLNTEVLRTKESAREMMQAVRSIPFQPLFDALYSMVKVIGYLAEKRLLLSDLMQGLPSFHMARQAVFCDWKNKGKVMRMMMEETKGKQVELLDGIKVYDSDGWVLIMPDMDQPHFRVITQGASKEIASTLAKTYAERIQKYQTI
ncbi:sugar phosphate nucleotidyltransferase [Ammoniphilus sp. CFH 90114]|uniref:sugar phosphate nucleotidyltransferase n=1 Tax=Ammoniphilus sp. CFH 90114 TaxID=2493665 RepID=UPI00100EACC9|nr:sugar phosphate nucleotidyltransferase [Ammoniphilus sp. CFH 90114]RXT15026.1 mannose-1-phosphate guanyltransferase [Ammoniphilus sp. CFH 90114]